MSPANDVAQRRPLYSSCMSVVCSTSCLSPARLLLGIQRRVPVGCEAPRVALRICTSLFLSIGLYSSPFSRFTQSMFETDALRLPHFLPSVHASRSCTWDGFGDTLDVIDKNLSVALGAALVQTFIALLVFRYL